MVLYSKAGVVFLLFHPMEYLDFGSLFPSAGAEEAWNIFNLFLRKEFES
jgi:hypothetical protein